MSCQLSVFLVIIVFTLPAYSKSNKIFFIFFRTWSPIYSRSLSRLLPLSVPTHSSQSFTSSSSCPQTARTSDFCYSERKLAKPLNDFSSQTKLKSRQTNWRPVNHHHRRRHQRLCRRPKTTSNWCAGTRRSCTRSLASLRSWCRLCLPTESLPLTLCSLNRARTSATPCSGSGRMIKGLGTLMDSTIAGKFFSSFVPKTIYFEGVIFCLDFPPHRCTFWFLTYTHAIKWNALWKEQLTKLNRVSLVHFSAKTQGNTSF